MPTPVTGAGTFSPTASRPDEDGRTSVSGGFKLEEHLNNNLPGSTDQAAAQKLPSVSWSAASRSCDVNGAADPNQSNDNSGESVMANGSTQAIENGSSDKEVISSSSNKQGYPTENPDAIGKIEQSEQSQSTWKSVTNIMTTLPSSTDANTTSDGEHMYQGTQSNEPNQSGNNTIAIDQSASETAAAGLLSRTAEEKRVDDGAIKPELKKKRARVSNVDCLEIASDVASEAKKRNRPKRPPFETNELPTQSKHKVEVVVSLDALTGRSHRGSSVTDLEAAPDIALQDKNFQMNADAVMHTAMMGPIIENAQNSNKDKNGQNGPSNPALVAGQDDTELNGTSETSTLAIQHPSSQYDMQSIQSQPAATSGANNTESNDVTKSQERAKTSASNLQKSVPEQNKDATIELPPSQGDGSARRSTRPKKPFKDAYFEFHHEDETERPLKRTKKSETSASQRPSRAVKKPASYSLDVYESSQAPEQKGGKQSDVQFDEKIISKLTKQSSLQQYHEESSYRYHNPPFPNGSHQLALVRSDRIPGTLHPVRPAELKPLPPSADPPEFPSTGYCTWSFNVDTRVLLANFRANTNGGKVSVTREDEEFLLKMMERDDITVISEGLVDELDSTLLDRGYVEGSIGSEFHHKVKEFKNTPVKPRGCALTGEVNAHYEEKGWYSMTISDYFAYLDRRQTYIDSKTNDVAVDGGDADAVFTFTDSEGKEISIDASEVVLYLLDLDMVKTLPLAYQDFTQSIKLPGILPGGSHCMMYPVNINGRPFMGPNIYMTPPSSFTLFHQDGHGTVDSGHYCHRGFNEVIMLRRLPERHKHHALHLLNGTNLSSDSFLYGKPHDQEVQSRWPTNDAIERCQKMGYHPSVFILKPGQLVHINKGRLHAFRKLSPSHLHDRDCHYTLREEILPSVGSEGFTCVSVAWDWMFKGVTSEGINREVASILECARLNQKHSVQSLAIPETALISLAKEHAVRLQIQNRGKASGFVPDSKTILRGILPSLQFVVHRHIMTENASKSWMEGGKHEKVSIDSKPNAWQNPDSFSLDPFGCGDFICKFCHEELSNVYMHCDGCERLLNKDFNICTTCHSELKYKANIQMHPINPRMKASLNHMGSVNFKRQSRCPCKDGPACGTCTYCLGCSCTCHQQFTLHHRFMPVEQELDLLQQVEAAVGTDVIPSSLETKVRLFSLLSEDFQVPSGAFSNDGVHVHMNSSRNRATCTVRVVNPSQEDIYEGSSTSEAHPPDDDEGNVDAISDSPKAAPRRKAVKAGRGRAHTKRSASQKLAIVSGIKAELSGPNPPSFESLLAKYGIDLGSFYDWKAPDMLKKLEKMAKEETFDSGDGSSDKTRDGVNDSATSARANSSNNGKRKLVQNPVIEFPASTTNDSMKPAVGTRRRATNSVSSKARRSAAQKLSIVSEIEKELDLPDPPDLKSLLTKHEVSFKSFNKWKNMKANLQQSAFIEQAYDSVGSESNTSGQFQSAYTAPIGRRGSWTATQKLSLLSQVDAELKAPNAPGLNDILSKYEVSRTLYSEWSVPSNKQGIMEAARSESGDKNDGVRQSNATEASTISTKVASRRRSASQKLAIISNIETKLDGPDPPTLKNLLAKYDVSKSSWKDWRAPDMMKKLKEIASKEEALDSTYGANDSATPAKLSSSGMEDESEDDSSSDPMTKDVLDALGSGSRVIIYHAAEYWNATVVKRGKDKREGQFLIHYDGQKKSKNDWVPEDQVARLLHDKKQP